jgi:3-mercaptopyruvate sulfurtransferase SseA
MEQRIQSWGVSPGRKVVVYDQGGDMMAPRLFFDLYVHGVPATDIYLLDGGLAKWKAAGGAVTEEPTPAPPKGNWRITEVRESERARLAEFFVATGDPARHAVVDALEPSYYYGERKFFDRAGHVPHAQLLGHAEFFAADKTFKSPDEIRRLARYFGVRAEQTVLTHCGGGVAAAVPWFALRFVAGYPQVKLYLESQREWLRDERGLPFWTYAAPQLLREGSWLAGWNGAMLRMFDAARLNLVDVRAADKYALGHAPFALHVPAETFGRHLGQPEQLAALLGPAGVNPAHEVVLMSDGALTPAAALAFLAFEQLGHRRVSVLTDSVDDWGLRGFELTRQPTTVGAPKSPQDFAVPPAKYVAAPRGAVVITDPNATRGEYPKVFVAAGKAGAAAASSKLAPAAAADTKVVPLPYTTLLDAEGRPKPAKDLWKLISAAGVPRHAEVIVFADDPAEAAVGYFVFRLMGWPDVKVWMAQ